MARTTSRRSNGKPQRRLSGVPLGADPTTILNPYARPKAGSARLVVGELPELVDHTGDPCAVCGVRHEVTFAIGVGDALSADNPLVWTLFYRSEFASGRTSSMDHYQRVIAAMPQYGGREKAILTLLALRRGLCSRVHLYHVEPPVTAEQAAEAAEANRIWQRIKNDSPQRHGGHGE